MKLTLKNIGKLRDASVEINGITVIAGENDTGKSTVGKVLYSVFNSFYHIGKKILSERLASIENQLQIMQREASIDEYWVLDTDDLAYEILTEVSTEGLNLEELRSKVYHMILEYDDRIWELVPDEAIEDAADRISQILVVQDREIFKTVLQRNLDAEFNGQIGNLFLTGDSAVRLGIRNEAVNITIRDNKVIEFDRRINLGTEAIYIDDPFVLDELQNRIWRGTSRYPDHRANLKSRLNASRNHSSILEEIVKNKKFEQIYAKISEVCEGDVVKEKRSTIGYRVGKQTLEVRNMSTGLKTFAILKKLLVSGWIEENGTIILDEPEIHLHPEWQLLFAELIVLMHKEFGLHILLNTHSPYFLNAIEVYAAKHEVDSKCKYYLTRSDKMLSYVEDVTDHIEAIYQKLARPLQVLENERYHYD